MTRCNQAVPTGKSDYAPNCPVRALRYYHRYITEHLELRKGRCCLLFVRIKDNNTGKELSAATVSRWICTTIVDSHAALWRSKSIPGKSSRCPHSGYFVATLQGRPTSSDEGLKMVQQRHLHVLLPYRHLSAS